MLLEIVLIFSVFLSATQTTEICKSDSGKMTISEETNILAIFKGMAIWVVKFNRKNIKRFSFYIENNYSKSQFCTFLKSGTTFVDKI